MSEPTTAGLTLDYACVIPPPTPPRVLGPFDATCVVIGAIIGVGIFFTPARTAQLAGSGPLMLLTWAIAGAIALCGALTFAELGGLYHASGAQYEILRDACGPLPAFVFVFCNATAVQAGAIGVIAVVCAQNLGIALRGSPPPDLAALITALALIVAITAANIVGVRWGARIQNLSVVAKLAALLAIMGLAAVLGRSGLGGRVASASTTPHGPIAGILAALVPALFSFGGWQAALWVAGEVKSPARTLPRAILGGVVITIVVYFLINAAYLRLLGADGVAHSKALAADSVAAVWPSLGRRLTAAAVAISAFGVLNSQLLTGPRLVYGMARDGRFFAPFAEVSPRFSTPVWSILLLSGVAVALLLAVGPDRVGSQLLTGVVFIDTVFFALTGLSLIILRRKRPDAARPMRVPGYPIIPVLFIVGEIGVGIGAYVEREARVAALIGVAWIVAAVALYWVRFRRTGVSTS